MNVGVRIEFLVELLLLILLDTDPEVEFLDPYGHFIFNFLRKHHTVFHAAVPFSTPTNGAQGIPNLHDLANPHCVSLAVVIQIGVRGCLSGFG